MFYTSRQRTALALLLIPALTWAQTPPSPTPFLSIGPLSAAPAPLALDLVPQNLWGPAKPKTDALQFGFGEYRAAPAPAPTGNARRGFFFGLTHPMDEGKPLETMIWGGGGAVAGSMVGPLGTLVGAAVGSTIGLLISIFVVPHNGPNS